MRAPFSSRQRREPYLLKARFGNSFRPSQTPSFPPSFVKPLGFLLCGDQVLTISTLATFIIDGGPAIGYEMILDQFALGPNVAEPIGVSCNRMVGVFIFDETIRESAQEQFEILARIAVSGCAYRRDVDAMEPGPPGHVAVILLPDFKLVGPIEFNDFAHLVEVEDGLSRRFSQLCCRDQGDDYYQHA